MFFPTFYVLVPLQESGYCICSFYEMQANGTDLFLLKLGHSTFEILSIANSLSFYLINWIGLFILIWLVYRIRHTGDDTHLKVECMFIVGIWLVFSLGQIIIFVYNYTLRCHGQMGMIEKNDLERDFSLNYKLLYWFTIGRDLLCLLVMVVFQYRAASSQQYFNRLLD